MTSTLDPLKLALSGYSQEAGSFPVHAGITAATSTTTPVAAVVGDVWDSIGLKYEPTVPPELASLTYKADALSPQGVSLVLTFSPSGIGTGIDGKVLAQKVLIGGTGVVWICDKANTTITSAVALKYFGC